jgi:hypothetical protein
VLVKLLVGDAGLHRRVEVAGIDLHNPVHRREVEADPAPQRRNVTLEGRPGSERNDWYLVARADLDGFAHLAGGVHEGDGVRRHAGMVRRILAVPFTHRGGGRQAIAQQLLQRGNGRLASSGDYGFDGGGHAHNTFMAVVLV